jgi:hypothetical protein
LMVSKILTLPSQQVTLQLQPYMTKMWLTWVSKKMAVSHQPRAKF